MLGWLYCTGCFCYAIAISTQKLRWDISLTNVTLCTLPTPTHGLRLYPPVWFRLRSLAFSSFPSKKTASNVSLVKESHGWVWFITGLTHMCRWFWESEGPAEGKFINNKNKLPFTTEQEECVRLSALHTLPVRLQPRLFTVGLLCVLSAPLSFFFSSSRFPLRWAVEWRLTGWMQG